jgi:hypothetical protein
MLHKEAVDTHILYLIKELQSLNDLTGFILVGGTALALQMGHRRSVDIDLFTQEPFHPEELAGILEAKFGFQLQYSHRNTLKGVISGIFVDLITHDYDLIQEPLVVDTIRSASLKDIAAMKVNAISGDGTRLKDFIDIYFLLKNFSFEEIIGFFCEKYNSRNEFHAIKSLTYFDDIDSTGWPEMILEPKLTLNQIKRSLIQKRDLFINKINS